MTEAVCTRLAAGETIRAITAEKDMPCWTAIQGWLVRHREFRQLYAAARAIHADYEFERIREIEDKVLDKTLDPNAARVVLTSINWRLGRMKPKVYGDYRTQDINVAGAIHVKRITLVHEREDADG